MLSSRETAIANILDNRICTYEFFRCMLGDLLGEGAFRYVFNSPFNPSEVIKIDISEGNHNVIEWDLWHEIKGIPEIAKWFCPVVKMSPCGRVLIMKKANMDKSITDYPTELPSFFSDVKKNNFGFYKGNLVCIDYGYNAMYHTGTKIKMIKATW